MPPQNPADTPHEAEGRQTSSLDEWAIRSELTIDAALRRFTDSSAAVRAAVPSEADWPSFLAAIREERARILRAEDAMGDVVLILFAGVAFFGYEANRFWDYFKSCFGPLSGPEHERLVEAFQKACAKRNIDFRTADGTRKVVETAVQIVGIPVDYVDEAVKIAGLAVQRGSYSSWTGEEWRQLSEHVASQHVRLGRFAGDHPRLMSQFVDAMRAAQELVDRYGESGAQDFASDDVLLRPEYFDRVGAFREWMDPERPEGAIRGQIYLCYSPAGAFGLDLPETQESDAEWGIAGDATSRAAANKGARSWLELEATTVSHDIQARLYGRHRLGATVAAVGDVEVFDAEEPGRRIERNPDGSYPAVPSVLVARFPVSIARTKKLVPPPRFVERNISGVRHWIADIRPSIRRRAESALVELSTRGLGLISVRFSLPSRGESRERSAANQSDAMPLRRRKPLPLCWRAPSVKHLSGTRAGDFDRNSLTIETSDRSIEYAWSAEAEAALGRLAECGAIRRDGDSFSYAAFVIADAPGGALVSGLTGWVLNLLEWTRGHAPEARLVCGSLHGVPGVLVEQPGVGEQLRAAFSSMNPGEPVIAEVRP